MAGIVFAKLSRPKARARTVTFSKNAVVSMVNGKLRLMFRVANARNTQLLEAHSRALLLGNLVTKEGATYRNFPTELSLSTQIQEQEEEERKEYGHVFLPLLVCHTIDPSSPLYNISPAQLNQSKVELLVTLEGIVEQTGNTMMARTSFLPSEILWGHTFASCVTYANKEGVYLVDHSRMDEVQADETPRLSAKQIQDMEEMQSSTQTESYESKYGSNNRTLSR
jgi:hypothetical protein